MLSVGILGATGFMGAPFSRALLKAHRAGHLRFVILHRPESNLARYPPDVEKRCIDLARDDRVKAAEKLKDLQVVISTVSWLAENVQYRLVDALRDSPNLVTFFPSEYATPHRAEDLASPLLAGSGEKARLAEYCVKQNVPCTRLFVATVPSLLFQTPGFSSFKPAENRLELYWPLGEGKRGLSSETFSGRVLVHLLLNRLNDLPNASFSIVELSWSAQDLITVFTKLHDGQEPTIVKYTEEEYQEGLHKSFMDAMQASSRKGLAAGAEWPGEIIHDIPGWEPRTLEDYVRPGLTDKPLTMQDIRGGSDLSRD